MEKSDEIKLGSETNGNSNFVDFGQMKNIMPSALSEIDDHITPVANMQAVAATVVDSNMSDDEFPRTLLTLESKKKTDALHVDEDHEIEICPYNDDDDEEEAILLEVYNEEAHSDGFSDAKANDDLKSSANGGDDLIAILEGVDDNTEHYKVTIPMGQKTMSKEEEVEIAMKQIMNLPKKKKGRPRKPETIARLNNGNESFNALVAKDEERNSYCGDTEILVEIKGNGIAEINAISKGNKRMLNKEADTSVPKRSRVIKKKIIWDPDAPETAINYASFAQSKALTIKSEPNECEITPQKKKKMSEIDKLLGDEGAANMLNSLTTNNDSPAEKTSRKSSRADAISAIANKVSPTLKESIVAPKPAARIGKKRGPKTTQSTWDSLFASRCDDSLIIRRRSNSSFSSTTSLDKFSSDANEGLRDDVKVESRPTGRGKARSNKVDQRSLNNFLYITVSKQKKFVQIAFKSREDSLLSIHLMDELIQVLKLLENDSSCNLILLNCDDNGLVTGIDKNSINQQSDRYAAVNELVDKLG